MLGVDVTSKRNTLLIKAVRHGSVKIVKLLIEAGANVNARSGGETPLIYASLLNKYEEKVKILIEAGANINAVNTEGFTALMKAAISGSEENVKDVNRLEKIHR